MKKLLLVASGVAVLKKGGNVYYFVLLSVDVNPLSANPTKL